MNYKKKELKTYGVLESLHQGLRRYRSVLDEAEACYINAEFSFYNLQFDQADWNANITFRVLEHFTNREICKLEKPTLISKDQNVVYVRDGWGTPQPGFWKRGTYKWEAYIDGALVDEIYFYLNVELTLRNKATQLDNFPLEIYFYVYNEQQYLKAQMGYFAHINDRRAEIVLESGYGVREPGFWQKGNYTVNIVFMDTVIGSFAFNVGDSNVPFSGVWATNSAVLPPITNAPPPAAIAKDKYKLKEIKSYGSLESLFQGNRRYRSVFDESEICYANVEAAFYNILFSEEDWEATILLRAINYHTYAEVCRLEKKMTIAQDQNVVYVRDGWGTPEPGFWKQGTYRWEVTIDGKLLGETYFYIVNNGLLSADDNPYFDLKSIKLFEGPYEGLEMGKRIYLEKFDHKTTRYINVELTLENKLTNMPYMPLEFQVNVYNDSHFLKAYMSVFKHINDQLPKL
ncbi:MAG: hypothetical protein IPL33_05775 [Sphingobacteriales bacterium]|nr:hypothetical protein [Sphingobacteriales bacterium]